MLCQRDGSGGLLRQAAGTAGRQKLQEKWWEEFKGLCEITDVPDHHIILQRGCLKKKRKIITAQELQNHRII